MQLEANHHLVNSYFSSDTYFGSGIGEDLKEHKITEAARDDELHNGPVRILCGKEATLQAKVLPLSSCLSVRGQMFTLRKVQIDSPLGNYAPFLDI